MVLLACLVTYTLVISVESDRWLALVSALPVVALITIAVLASRAGPPLRWGALGLVGAAVVMGVINAARHGPDPEGVSLLLTGLALVVCLLAMLVRMASHTRITVRTVMAVLASYVMLGLIFTYVDSGVSHITNEFFAQAGQHSQSDFAYFSYITLTTVGYGDLTPITGIGRSLASLEALIGQIFLVTLVARMVSLFGTERAPLDLRDRRNLREEMNGPE